MVKYKMIMFTTVFYIKNYAGKKERIRINFLNFGLVASCGTLYIWVSHATHTLFLLAL